MLGSRQAGRGLELVQGGANNQREAPWACLSHRPRRREEVWQEAGGGGGRRAVSRAVGGRCLSWLAETARRASWQGAGSGHLVPAHHRLGAASEELDAGTGDTGTGGTRTG